MAINAQVDILLSWVLLLIILPMSTPMHVATAHRSYPVSEDTFKCM